VANRSIFLNLFVLALLTVTLAACGDTWRGMKQDTGENLEATGEADRGRRRGRPAVVDRRVGGAHGTASAVSVRLATQREAT
jgi:predicted small secreted protein